MWGERHLEIYNRGMLKEKFIGGVLSKRGYLEIGGVHLEFPNLLYFSYIIYPIILFYR